MTTPDTSQHEAISRIRDIEQSINDRLRQLHDNNKAVTALVGTAGDGPTLAFNVANGDAELERSATALLALIKPLLATDVTVSIVPDEFQIDNSPLKALRIAVSVHPAGRPA